MSEIVVQRRELAAREGQLLMMAAFVQGFADKLVSDLESRQPGRQGTDLPRSDEAAEGGGR